MKIPPNPVIATRGPSGIKTVSPKMTTSTVGKINEERKEADEKARQISSRLQSPNSRFSRLG